MSAIYLLLGIIAKAEEVGPPPAQPFIGGSYEPNRTRRKKREAEEREARERLRNIIRAAWDRVHEPEAAALIELVKPATAVPFGPALPVIEWSALATRMAAIEAAARAFQQSQDDEEDELAMVLMLA